MDNKIKTWRVRLGKMYYVQGLFRNFIEEATDHNSYEFTSYKEAAWLFPLEFAAHSVAESCGGVVETIEITREEYHRLDDLREYHTKASEGDWYRKQEAAIQQFYND